MMSATEKATYPLSSLQRELWVNQLLYPNVPLFNVGGHVRIDGAIALASFAQALHSVIQADDAWRIMLHEGDPLPQQSFTAPIPVTLHCHDFSEQESAALAWMQHEFTQPFPLYDSPLCHFALCKVTSTRYYWFIKCHYLIADGKTIDILIRRVATAYNALISGQPLVTPRCASYRDFIRADAAYSQSTSYGEDAAYWQRQYATLPEPLLRLRHPRPEPMLPGARSPSQAGNTATDGLGALPEVTHSGATLIPSRRATLYIEPTRFAQLSALAAAQGATVGDAILGLLYCYFARIHQQTDLVIGYTNLLWRENAVLGQLDATVQAGGRTDFGETPGFFMNVTPARLAFGTALPYTELLQAIGRQTVRDRAHGLAPIGEINRQAKVTRDQRAQLFEVEVAYADFDFDLTFGGAPIQLELLSHYFEQYALTLYVKRLRDAHAHHQDIRIDFDYNLGYLQEDEISLLLERFDWLLRQVLAHPNRPLDALSLMSDRERNQVLVAFNETATVDTPIKCVHQLFEAQVVKTPHAPALIFEQQRLSYNELNQKANQLAHYLRQLGVGEAKETLVAVAVNRSPEMIISVLGILKAGGAYVPLDPNYPSSRLAYMVQDANAPLVLTQAALVDQLPTGSARVICLDRDWPCIAQCCAENPAVTVAPTQLAYVIYTSGSTGKPKGVLLEHGGLTNVVAEHIRACAIQPGSRSLQFVSFSFDVATLDIFMNLCAGATLYLPGETKTLLGEDLAQWLREHAITHAQIPPSVLSGFPADIRLPALQTLITGGEAFSPTLVKQWSARHRFLNAYGPTEATICTTIAQFTDGAHKLSIGRPIANAQVYILGTDLQPVPIGVAGELYIGGRGIARGYLNLPELTAERFIPDPFVPTNNGGRAACASHGAGRLYKTGDLACWLADGTIEFIGRIDSQVKIRGFRIELGEIENGLLAQDGIREAVVLAREDTPGDKRLVAYLVGEADPETLRQQLAQRLPDYMIPAAFVMLAALPLTPNGKLDRRAMPAPDYTAAQSAFVAPRTVMETQVAAIWQEALGIAAVGVYDNFFALGGHSLLAIQLVNQIRTALQLDLPLGILFQAPTIASLAEWLDQQTATAPRAAIQPVARTLDLPLSLIQEDVWRRSQTTAFRGQFDNTTRLHMTGALDVKALRQSFGALIARQEMLRTSFPVHNGVPVQMIAPTLVMELPLIDLRAQTAAEQASTIDQLIEAEKQQSFDLLQGPLWRVSLVRLAPTEHLLLLSMHHILGDNDSSALMLEELATFYNGYVTGQPVTLPPLAMQYADYAYWQRQLFTPAVLAARQEYWRRLLTPQPPLLSLPSDYERPAEQNEQSYPAANSPFSLPLDVAQQLMRFSRTANVTPFMTILAAYALLLHRYSACDDFMIGSVTSRRDDPALAAMFGHFASMSWLRIKVQGAKNFMTLVERVSAVTLEALVHQDINLRQLLQVTGRDWLPGPFPRFRAAIDFVPLASTAVPFAGLTLTTPPLERRKIVGDLALFIRQPPQIDGDSLLQGYWSYRQDLFAPVTIARLNQSFQTLLRAVLADPDQALDAYHDEIE